jgi:hypothetical protein
MANINISINDTTTKIELTVNIVSSNRVVKQKSDDEEVTEIQNLLSSLTDKKGGQQ